jgi:hypothetical protein
MHDALFTAAGAALMAAIGVVVLLARRSPRAQASRDTPAVAYSRVSCM